jgi:integrase
LRLTAYTIVRAHDARAARWSDVDLKAATWETTVHKTSDFTGMAFTVPLTRQALDVLGEYREAALKQGFGGRCDYVFPPWTRHPCEVCGLPEITEDKPRQVGHVDKSARVTLAIKAEAGIGERGLLHRMRALFATKAGKARKDRGLKEASLNPVITNGIESIYDHSQWEEDGWLEERRPLMTWATSWTRSWPEKAAPRPRLTKR